ncbi:hypothetical protein FQN49_007354 [Arthroderma sp. PD_2]|nr:hypothetical protein FQN49_007354 [Arthroderma sp. PD_2]
MGPRALATRAPFSATIPAQKTVYEWLVEMHQTTLDILEFDGLMHSLPEYLMQDRRIKSTNVLCVLDMPQSSTNWSYKDMQEHHFMMSWYVSQDGQGLKTEIDIQLGQIDQGWAEAAKTIPGKMLGGLVKATKETLVEDLLR